MNFTARIDFADYDAALAQLRAADSFLEPHEGKLVMPPEAGIAGFEHTSP